MATKWAFIDDAACSRAVIMSQHCVMLCYTGATITPVSYMQHGDIAYA